MVIQVKLDGDSETPLYRQLGTYLQELIANGGLNAGDRLPPTRDLAGQLGLNRTTVSAAYDMLQEEGFLEARGARGSFVTLPRRPAADPVWARLLKPSIGWASLPPAAGVIDFTTSRPSAKLFPLEEFRASTREVLDSPETGNLLQLGSPRGYEPLRNYLLDRAIEDGTAHLDDDILITSGCQQAVDLLRRALVEPGDRVVLEEPVYPGLRASFLAAGAEVVGVPVSSNGIEIARLDGPLTGAKLIVVTPNFQNPTGGTIPAANRQALLRKTGASGTVVIENDIYSDLSYSGPVPPPLKRHDRNAILMGSFSKVAFPGLRVGWVIAPRPVIDRLAELKQITDLHTDQLSQAFLLHFAEKGLLEQHRERAIAAGRAKLRVVEHSLGRELAGCKWTSPSGGMNIWVELPDALDAAALRPLARQSGIDYLPGSFFSVSRPLSNGLRLSFIGLEPDQIRKGIEILGQLVRNSVGWQERESSLPAPALV